MTLRHRLEPLADRLLKLSRPVRLVLIGVIALAIGAGYYAFPYREAALEVAQLQDQAHALQRKLAKVRVVAENLVEFEREVRVLETELEIALRQLPNRKQFEDLLQDVTTAGKKVGVQIQSIQRAPEMEKGFYAEVPFRIELEGEFHGIAMFFDRVAKLPRIVNIGALTVSLAQDSRDATVLRVVGDATTFRFLATPDEPGKSGAPSASAAKDRAGRV